MSLIGQKKVVLFPEIGRVKFFLLLTRLHSPECVSEYIFLVKKKQRELKKKRDLTGYEDIVCELALSTFDFLDQVVNFSWLFI